MTISPVSHNTRPEGQLLPQEAAAFDLLDKLGIEYDRVSHDAAFNMELCAEVGRALDVSVCKNLFLCNRQKTQFYLLMLEGEKVFKTKDLSKQLGVARLSFADAADMERYLDITPCTAPPALPRCWVLPTTRRIRCSCSSTGRSMRRPASPAIHASAPAPCG